MVSKIQFQAARYISSAYKRSSLDALNVELSILPADLRLKQVTQRALLRMNANPKGRELINSLPATTAESTIEKARLYGPLAEHKYDFEKLNTPILQSMETKTGFVVPPWAESIGTTVVIAPSREVARLAHDEFVEQEGIHIYTDGSGINDRWAAQHTA
jgi:hypothetical protein